MKQKDVALILIVVFVSVVASIVASKLIITSPKNRQQKVEVVEPIIADFPKPDSRYFNTNSVDPTKLITIGQDVNPQPFNSPSE